MPRLRTGSKQVIRDINRTIILNLIKQHIAVSRAQIAEFSSLAAPTVSEIVAGLLAEGLIVETGTVTSRRRGPRPVLLELNRNGGVAVGVMLRPDGMNLVITDLLADVIHRAHHAFSHGMEPDQMLSQVVDQVRAQIRAAKIAWPAVLGLGVGLSGMIDSTTGRCRESYILGWSDVDVGGKLAAALGIPIHVDNDTKTLTVAEQHFGLGQNRHQFVLVTVGRGVGLGAVVNGELLRGHQDVGAEFGHVTMLLNGPRCPCGNSGCLEAIASDVGICHAAVAIDPARYGGMSIEQLTELAQAGDRSLRPIFEQAGEMLGVGLANLINVFAPELLVLTGEGLRAGDLLLDPLRRTLARCAFRGRLELTEIAIKPWDPAWEPWARGAATLVLDDLLRVPLYEHAAENRATVPTRTSKHVQPLGM